MRLLLVFFNSGNIIFFDTILAPASCHACSPQPPTIALVPPTPRRTADEQTSVGTNSLSLPNLCAQQSTPFHHLHLPHNHCERENAVPGVPAIAAAVSIGEAKTSPIHRPRTAIVCNHHVTTTNIKAVPFLFAKPLVHVSHAYLTCQAQYWIIMCATLLKYATVAVAAMSENHCCRACVSSHSAQQLPQSSSSFPDLPVVACSYLSLSHCHHHHHHHPLGSLVVHVPWCKAVLAVHIQPIQRIFSASARVRKCDSP